MRDYEPFDKESIKKLNKYKGDGSAAAAAAASATSASESASGSPQPLRRTKRSATSSPAPGGPGGAADTPQPPTVEGGGSTDSQVFTQDCRVAKPPASLDGLKGKDAALAKDQQDMDPCLVKTAVYAEKLNRQARRAVHRFPDLYRQIGHLLDPFLTERAAGTAAGDATNAAAEQKCGRLRQLWDSTFADVMPPKRKKGAADAGDAARAARPQTTALSGPQVREWLAVLGEQATCETLGQALAHLVRAFASASASHPAAVWAAHKLLTIFRHDAKEAPPGKGKATGKKQKKDNVGGAERPKVDLQDLRRAHIVGLLDRVTRALLDAPTGSEGAGSTPQLPRTKGRSKGAKKRQEIGPPFERFLAACGFGANAADGSESAPALRDELAATVQDYCEEWIGKASDPTETDLERELQHPSAADEAEDDEGGTAGPSADDPRGSGSSGAAATEAASTGGAASGSPSGGGASKTTAKDEATKSQEGGAGVASCVRWRLFVHPEAAERVSADVDSGMVADADTPPVRAVLVLGKRYNEVAMVGKHKDWYPCQVEADGKAALPKNAGFSAAGGDAVAGAGSGEDEDSADDSSTSSSRNGSSSGNSDSDSISGNRGSGNKSCGSSSGTSLSVPADIAELAAMAHPKHVGPGGAAAQPYLAGCSVAVAASADGWEGALATILEHAPKAFSALESASLGGKNRTKTARDAVEKLTTPLWSCTATFLHRLDQCTATEREAHARLDDGLAPETTGLVTLIAHAGQLFNGATSTPQDDWGDLTERVLYNCLKRQRNISGITNIMVRDTLHARMHQWTTSNAAKALKVEPLGTLKLVLGAQSIRSTLVGAGGAMWNVPGLVRLDNHRKPVVGRDGRLCVEHGIKVLADAGTRTELRCVTLVWETAVGDNGAVFLSGGMQAMCTFESSRIVAADATEGDAHDGRLRKVAGDLEGELKYALFDCRGVAKKACVRKRLGDAIPLVNTKAKIAVMKSARGANENGWPSSIVAKILRRTAAAARQSKALDGAGANRALAIIKIAKMYQWLRDNPGTNRAAAGHQAAASQRASYKGDTRVVQSMLDIISGNVEGKPSAIHTVTALLSIQSKQDAAVASDVDKLRRWRTFRALRDVIALRYAAMTRKIEPEGEDEELRVVKHAIRIARSVVAKRRPVDLERKHEPATRGSGGEVAALEAGVLKRWGQAERSVATGGGAQGVDACYSPESLYPGRLYDGNAPALALLLDVPATLEEHRAAIDRLHAALDATAPHTTTPEPPHRVAVETRRRGVASLAVADPGVNTMLTVYFSRLGLYVKIGAGAAWHNFVVNLRRANRLQGDLARAEAELRSKAGLSDERRKRLQEHARRTKRHMDAHRKQSKVNMRRLRKQAIDAIGANGANGDALGMDLGYGKGRKSEAARSLAIGEFVRGLRVRRSYFMSFTVGVGGLLQCTGHQRPPSAVVFNIPEVASTATCPVCHSRIAGVGMAHVTKCASCGRQFDRDAGAAAVITCRALYEQKGAAEIAFSEPEGAADAEEDAGGGTGGHDVEQGGTAAAAAPGPAHPPRQATPLAGEENLQNNHHRHEASGQTDARTSDET